MIPGIHWSIFKQLHSVFSSVIPYLDLSHRSTAKLVLVTCHHFLTTTAAASLLKIKKNHHT